MKGVSIGWKVLPLGYYVERLDSGTSVNCEDRPAQDGEAGMLKLSCVTEGRFAASENKAILPSERNRASTYACGGAILISRSNTVDLVGASASVPKDFPNLFIPDTLWQTVFRKGAAFDPAWLGYVLSSPSIRRRLRELAAGTSASMKKLTKPAVLGLEVLSPPLSEQREISKVLNCCAYLLDSLDRVIEAKCLRRRGLMQQLLTGRTRFKEFRGERWRTVYLGDVAVESNARNNGKMDRLALMAVTKAQGMVPMREQVQGESVARCKIVEPGWFAYNPMRLNIGSIAKWTGESEVMVSGDYVVFHCDGDRVDDRWLDQFRRTHRWTSFVQGAGNGSVRVRIWFSDLGFLKFQLPPLEEQRRVVDVLETCDREIQLLVKQLDAVKEQKRGLMQKLLTGRGQSEV